MHRCQYDRISHSMFLDALKLFDAIIIPLFKPKSEHEPI